MAASGRPVRSVNSASGKPPFRRKGIHHEFAGQVGALDVLPGGDEIAARGALQVGARAAVARLAPDRGVGRQLAVGAGADAEVVAEAPVVEVVRARRAGPGEGRGFVVREAGRTEPGFHHLLHVGRQVVVGQRRRRVVERRVRLQRQVIGRDVADPAADRRGDVGFGLCQRLTRQRVHQVEIDALEIGQRQFDRAPRFGAVMDAAQRGELGVVETLHADRQPGHAGGAEGGELGRFGGAGIGLERDLGAGMQGQAHADRRQQRFGGFGTHQAGRAAADEDAGHRTVPDLRQGGFEIGDQGGEIGGLVDFTTGFRAN
jgi:hypothetical protein